MSDVNKLLDEAIKEIASLKDGEIFLVKDLLKAIFGTESLGRDRLLLGTLFLNQVNKMGGKGIKAIEKTSSNQQRYMKV